MVELLFGRLDGRTASFAATRDLIERYFPGDYTVIQPGADLQRPRRRRDEGPPEIVFSAEEERGALRLFLRALRRLPADLDWRATIWLRDPATAPAPTLSRRAARARARSPGPADGSEAQHLARADDRRGGLGGRRAGAAARAARAWPAARCRWSSRLPAVRGAAARRRARACCSSRATRVTLAAQLERLVARPGAA